MDAMDDLLSENPEIEEEEEDEDDELLNTINNDDQTNTNDTNNTDNVAEEEEEDDDDDDEEDDDGNDDDDDDDEEEEEDVDGQENENVDEDEVMDDADAEDENIENNTFKDDTSVNDNMDLDLVNTGKDELDKSDVSKTLVSKDSNVDELENNKSNKPDAETTTSELQEKDDTENESKDQKKKEKTPDLEPLDKLHHYYLSIFQSAKLANSYNIFPTAAIPIQTDVNAITVSKGLKYLFLGGSDGYIRKFDLLNTLQGKLSLTILQKHFLTESISNAGILLAYWENEVPQYKSKIKVINRNDYQPVVSPVYSLAVHNECTFLLSGLENGGITLQGVRYMESKIGYYFKEHTQVVNLLKLNNTEDKFLSGSWDKRLLEWDLNTGSVVNEYMGSKSELSSLEFRPLSSSIVIEHKPMENEIDQADSNNINKDEEEDDEMDSLFGDDDDDDEMRESIKESSQLHKQEQPSPPKSPQRDDDKIKSPPKNMSDEISAQTLNIVYDENVFMSSGLNGNIDIWDKRITTSPALTLTRGDGVPPWCFSATWSTNGDKIYAGRRNACVEEFDLKIPTKPLNTLKLASLSGPVTSVKAMPNGKHILIGSRDNIRLYDSTSTGSNIPFLIIPGHHGGTISNLYVDPTCRFMISTSGNRGWQGNATDITLIYDIELE